MELAQYILAAQIAASQLNVALKAGKFTGVQFAAKMSWGWKTIDSKKKTSLLVDCVPWMYESSEKSSQTRAGYECSVQVFLQQQFGPEELDQGSVPESTINRLATLVQKFDVFFKENPIPRHELAPEIKWTESNIIVACSRPDLENHRFRGVLKITCSAPKALVVNLT